MTSVGTVEAYDSFWMHRALSLADKAASLNEVPVGAILVISDQAHLCTDSAILAEGFNSPISSNDATAHAEIIALREASHRLQNYRLPHTTLYVTIEPCTMCVGALIHSRIERLVYGAKEPRAGAIDSNFQLTQKNVFNHRLSVSSGVLANECAAKMKSFFRTKR